MAWYVFALVDRPPSGPKGKGLSGALGLRSIPGGLAVVERRADVPPPEFSPLRRHHDVVAHLAARVPAIIPVRFGTLLDDEAIDEALGERGDEIEQAFEAVRDRVQFTWRRQARTSRGASARAKLHTLGELSGTEYLRRAARAATPSPPRSWRSLRAILAPLIAAERYQPATATTPESLYHLVPRDAGARYSIVATGLRQADAALTLTGPWAPFAFVPQVL